MQFFHRLTKIQTYLKKKNQNQNSNKINVFLPWMIHTWMRSPADVPELAKDNSALSMNPLHRRPPRLYLLLGEDARHVREPIV